jgi:hypothetical protein
VSRVTIRIGKFRGIRGLLSPCLNASNDRSDGERGDLDKKYKIEFEMKGLLHLLAFAEEDLPVSAYDM